MQKFSAYLAGIGLSGPGLPDWPQTRALFSENQPYTPEKTRIALPALLPATERRRAGRTVKLAINVGLEAVNAAEADPGELATVFASSGADGQNCHAICETLASADRRLSPTRFHNSVSNAPAGYWGIATHDTAASTVVSAYDATFGAGLLETMAQISFSHSDCLLIAYEDAYPEPLYAKRPLPDAFGVALLLTATPTARSLAKLSLSPSQDTANVMTDPALEALRLAIPSARALPLLQALAQQQATTVVLDYQALSRLAIEVMPLC